MVKSRIIFIVLALWKGIAAHADNYTMNYHVALDTARHYIDVRLDYSGETTEKLTLKMPVWLRDITGFLTSRNICATLTSPLQKAKDCRRENAHSTTSCDCYTTDITNNRTADLRKKSSGTP